MIIFRSLTFLMRPSPHYEWRADEKFDRPGFSYNHIHPEYRNDFRTLLFVTEEFIRDAAPPVVPIIVQENARRYHSHLFPSS